MAGGRNTFQRAGTWSTQAGVCSAHLEYGTLARARVHQITQPVMGPSRRKKLEKGRPSRGAGQEKEVDKSGRIAAPDSTGRSN